MEYKTIVKRIQEINIPSVYHHWDAEDVPKLPYIVHMMNGRDDRSADNINFNKIQNVTIELYSANPDFVNEEKIEIILEQMGLFYTKSDPFYLDKEMMYQTIYEFKFMEGKKYDN
ncbi:hypothetical protein [Erysipelothrix anatis]|uniref:hypothetical protein n=1 Tax=Erysipelothrix anatis TaxID=2683713 RepID=UPI0013595291|nr:hypothetical protein [Erysipelothrix anatis]